MSGKSHVDVSERRLRPIYDCLDNGNNKKALQEAEKVLKKQKDFQCAKVLKALALLRLGRMDESCSLLHEVHIEHPTDEAALQAMSIAYREINKIDMIADMYENAHKVKPDNEETLSALFMAYVRLGNFKKQQQTAMKLHRLKPDKNPYYFWAIMSIVMQAHSDEKLAKTMFLPLAERMAKKYVDGNLIDAEAEVQMYLIILEEMGKWEESLKVLQGPLGAKLVSELNCKEYKLAEMHMKMENWPEANAAYGRLLTEDHDNWNHYQEFFKTVFRLMQSNWSPGEDWEKEKKVYYSIESVKTFLEELLKEREGERRIRGPYLAQIEFVKQLKEKEMDYSSIGSPKELLEQYFLYFGDKNCCFGDLKIFLTILSDQEIEEFVNKMLTDAGCIGTDELNIATDVKVLQQQITAFQFARFAGVHNKLSKEEKIKLCKELVIRHEKGLEFGKELLTTDFQYSDNLMLLAAHTILDLWEETAEMQYVWQAILLLEKALRPSPSNFHIKLLLIKLYAVTGAFGPCAALYDSMEIKHVQNDALGYVISNHVTRLGHFMLGCSMYGAMLRFFTMNQKDTAEYLISSYKYGSFNKINEFVKFRERLQNSLQYASATAERMLLDIIIETNNHTNTEQLVTYMEIDPEKDQTNMDQLRDNRDLAVMLNWDQADKWDFKKVKEDSFDEEKAWLKLRNLTLRSLAAAVMIGKRGDHEHHNNCCGNGESKSKSMVDILNDLLQQLRSHITQCQTNYATPNKYPIHGPFRTRMSTFLKLNCDEILLDMFCIVTYIHKLQDQGMDYQDDKVAEMIKSSLVAKLKGLISTHKGSIVTGDEGQKVFHPDILEKLVLLAEILSHVAILCGVGNKLLKPMKVAISKRNKKKKGQPQVLPSTFGDFNTMVANLRAVTEEMKSAMDQLDPVLLSLELGNLQLVDTTELGEFDANLKSDMWKRVEMSYRQSSKEISDFLCSKMQYFLSLKL